MSEMKAGRYLDAMIAEKVMGQQVTGMPTALSDNDAHVTGEQYAGFLRCPAYSTDMAAAWRVVERIWERVIPKTYYGVYRLQLNRYDSGGYVCEFATDPEGDFSTHSRAEAETAPLAICRAALAAIEASALRGVPTHTGGEPR